MKTMKAKIISLHKKGQRKDLKILQLVKKRLLQSQGGILNMKKKNKIKRIIKKQNKNSIDFHFLQIEIIETIILTITLIKFYIQLLYLGLYVIYLYTSMCKNDDKLSNNKGLMS